jgi:hypothetical protein
MLGLSVNSSNIAVIPALQVGMGAGDLGKSIVNFGAYPTQFVDTFTVYTKTLFSIATLSNPLQLTAYTSNIVIQAVGSTSLSASLMSSGTATVSGDVGVSIAATIGNVHLQGGATTINLSQLTNSITSSSTNFTATTTDFNVLKSVSAAWFQTRSTTSLTCAASGPFASYASTSMYFPTDLIFDGQLLTSSATGLIKTAGFELCGTTIKTTGGILQLQDNTATKIIDVRGTITNGDPGYGVTFIDTVNGVNFQDTPIHNSLGVAGPLVCDDPEGFSVSNGTLYAYTMLPVPGHTEITVNGGGLTVSSGGVLKADTITYAFGGTVTLQGDLHVTGSVSATGTCCTSDARVKHNVTTIDPADDLSLILRMPERVAFQYTPGYQAVNKVVGNHVHHSFIAQDLELVLPRAVYSTNQTVDGAVIPDLRHLNLDRIVPHLVGAVKALSAQNEALKAELLELRELIKSMIK